MLIPCPLGRPVLLMVLSCRHTLAAHCTRDEARGAVLDLLFRLEVGGNPIMFCHYCRREERILWIRWTPASHR
jgi:hypothetical protein